ncbi:hypothetical protein BD779DRAFT_1163526 [Infundibulicybe gibba]|nr:hypothetical protein BD779DRAFT_1163526 [Infundibulicybe gibba]
MNKLQFVLALLIAGASAVPSPQTTPVILCDLSGDNNCPAGLLCCGPFTGGLGRQCIPADRPCPRSAPAQPSFL